MKEDFFDEIINCPIGRTIITPFIMAALVLGFIVAFIPVIVIREIEKLNKE